MWLELPRTRDEDGVALVTALLAVLAIGAVASLLFVNAIAENRWTGEARDAERALHMAEAGAETVFERIMAGDGTDVAWTGPADPSRAEERDWVLAQSAPGDTNTTPGGDGYGLGPVTRDGRTFVYGVGQVGMSERPRVVRTEIIPNESGGPLFAGQGLLFGGDLTVTGSHTVNGDVHVDGDLFLGHCGWYVYGRATVGGSHNAGNYEGKTDPRTEPGGCWMPNNIMVYDNPPEEVCLDWGCHPAWRPPVTAAGPEIPDIHARDVYDRHAAELGAQGRWFDMCREQVSGATRGVVRRGSDSPCTGEVVQVLRPSDHSGGNNDKWWHGEGWRYYDEGATQGSNVTRLPNAWVKVSADSAATPAVYYMHGTNFAMQAGHTSLDMTYIVAADPDDTGPERGRYSGNANVAGGVHARYVPELDGKWALFADRDIHSLTNSGGRTFVGNVYAREQIQWPGSSTATGSIISGDWHDDPGTPISTSDLGGSSLFTYDANLEPDGDPDDGAGGVLHVYSWQEL